MVTGTALLLETVADSGALVVPTACAAKVSWFGDKVTAVSTPTPDTLDTCGLLLPSSATLRAALRVPVADGVNAT